MKFKSTLLALALVFSSSAFAAPQPANLTGYDFNYSVDLNKSIGLTQVFDDGDRTYFQFTQADVFPKIEEIKNGKSVEISPEARPPYLIVNGVASKYKLSANKGKTAIYVSYNGNRIADLPKPVEQSTVIASQKVVEKPAEKTVQVDEQPRQAIKKSSSKKVVVKSEDSSNGNDDNAQTTGLVTGTLLNIPFFENSVTLSKKAKNDLLQRNEEITASTRVVVRGRPSVKGDVSLAKSRALAIKNYLLDMGIDENNIELSHSADIKSGKNDGFYVSELILLAGDQVASNNEKAAPKKQYWDLTLADHTLEAALNRWAAKAGYQPIVWDIAEELPINSSVRFEGSFEEAIDSVMQTLRNTDFPIKAKYYSNKVIRITSLTGAK